MAIILDIEYNAGFVIKELAYIEINNPLKLYHFIIRSADEDIKQNVWIYNNLHGIPMKCGSNINIKDIFKNIPANSKIYIQGLEKIQLLSRYLPTCQLIKIDAPSHLKLIQPYAQIQCPYSHSRIYCAVVKIYKYYNYIQSDEFDFPPFD